MTNSAGLQAPRAVPGVSVGALRKDDEKVLQGDASTRRSLNALAVSSSLMNALIRSPGPGAPHGAMVKGTQEMMTSANATTEELVAALRLGNVPWARYRILRMVAAAVAEQWTVSALDGQSGSPSADVRHLIPAWLEIAKHDAPEPVYEDAADNSRVALQVALLDAMEPVVREIGIFDMLHSEQEAAVHAKDVISSAVQASMANLLDAAASNRSRNQLLQALLRNAGTIYASAWRHHAQDVVDQLRQMDKAGQQMVAEMHPEGLPLEEVDEAFAGTYSRLVEMVQFLGDAPEPVMVANRLPPGTPLPAERGTSNTPQGQLVRSDAGFREPIDGGFDRSEVRR